MRKITKRPIHRVMGEWQKRKAQEMPLRPLPGEWQKFRNVLLRFRESVLYRFMVNLNNLKTIGRYEIVKKLGQGSKGAVYLGTDPDI